MEGYQQGSGRGRDGGKVQRISSINCRYKIARGRVGMLVEGGWRGIKERKWDNYNSIINKIYF